MEIKQHSIPEYVLSLRGQFYTDFIDNESATSHGVYVKEYL
jgi:hypothetical protein